METDLFVQQLNVAAELQILAVQEYYPGQVGERFVVDGRDVEQVLRVAARHREPLLAVVPHRREELLVHFCNYFTVHERKFNFWQSSKPCPLC